MRLLSKKYFFCQRIGVFFCRVLKNQFNRPFQYYFIILNVYLKLKNKLLYVLTANVFGKALKESVLCLNFIVLEKIEKGGVRVKNYRDIENTRYIISRVFAENKTTAMLIEQRVKDIKNNAPSLEAGGNIVYNNISGSIRSKEVK